MKEILSEERKQECPVCHQELTEGRHNCYAVSTILCGDTPKRNKGLLEVDDARYVNADSEIDDPMVGQVIDNSKYRIDEKIGKGGMGVVYKAKHLLIDRRVAIKVLNADLANNETARQRFRNEVRFAASVSHHNVVSATDFGTIEGNDTHFVVMELLEGESLRSRLIRIKRFPSEEEVSIMLPIAEALAVAHDAGICHRDIKPENIFIAKRSQMSDTPMLLDFGIAKRLDRTGDPIPNHTAKDNSLVAPSISTVNAEAETLEAENLPIYMTPEQLIGETLTRTGTIVGTPLYMSPEQLKGQRIDHRTDIYSFSAVVYEMLSGSTPIVASTKNSFINKLLYYPPQPFAAELEIPPALENCVKRGLAKNRDERQQSMREVITEMQSAVFAKGG